MDKDGGRCDAAPATLAIGATRRRPASPARQTQGKHALDPWR
ncbi:hypothetical protein OG625_36760 [Streptomyces sp. NBC_01351]|nr:hypothetical protein [Streptomyces sp. NBC_01351]